MTMERTLVDATSASVSITLGFMVATWNFGFRKVLDNRPKRMRLPLKHVWQLRWRIAEGRRCP